MARTMTCSCGDVLMGKDDEDLLRLGKEHMAQKHPDMKLTEDQMRGLIQANARDV